MLDVGENGSAASEVLARGLQDVGEKGTEIEDFLGAGN